MAAAALIGAFVIACSDRQSSDAVPGQALPQLGIHEHARIDGNQADLVPIPMVGSKGVVVGRDGGIAVAQPQDAVVRFFSPQGQPLGKFGGKGAGPGEFAARGIRGMGWIHDTLWVWDSGLRRTTLIGPNRELLRVLTGERSEDATVATAMAAVTLDGGTYEVFRVPYALLTDGGSLHLGGKDGESVLLRLDSNGAGVKLVSVIETKAESERKVFREHGGMMHVDLFPNGPFLGVSGNGERVAHVRSFLEGPKAPSMVVTVLRSGGDTIFSGSYPFSPVPLTRGVADSAVNAFITSVLARRPELRGVLRDVPTPPVYPPVADIVIGNEGDVWIQLRDTPPGRRYLVLDETGNPTGVLTVPLRSRVAAVGHGLIWMLEADDNDVQSVVGYRVQVGDGPGNR